MLSRVADTSDREDAVMDILIYALETTERAPAFEAPAPYAPERRAA